MSASDPSALTGEKARRLASELIHSFFTTQLNPMVKHHLTSYDQFLQQDIQAIIKANNPLLLMKNPKAMRGRVTDNYKYKVEVFIGGEDANELFLGTPTVALDNGNDVRVLLPNEARLRNLTYAVELTANIFVRLTLTLDPEEGSREPRIVVKTLNFPNQILCRIPLMLQSKHCLLNGKPGAMLAQMGECAYDQGGYFIIDGSEKVLVTRQEAAFNTLWISQQNQQKDPNVEWYASMSSLNPETREVKRVSFYWLRERITQSQGFKKQVQYQQPLMEVSIPYVLKPVPLFVLFRALGLQTDKEILQLIFPDPNHPDTKLLADMLIPTINAAAPFLDSYSAIQYIVSLTKGFSTAHVLDIVHNNLFPHVTEYSARPAFLAECVRKILRAVRGIEVPPSRDDTRHQRLQTSGFLCLMLFQNHYKQFAKKVILNIDQKYEYNESIYTDENFEKIFSEANPRELFEASFLTTGIMRGFKGKWETGPSSDESGILQELSRMSYIDFMSHLRHAVLNFDTSMKLAGPRRLNPSQYGYFCTSETPSGKNIGITKNITMLTMASTAMVPQPLIQWLIAKGRVVPCSVMTPSLAAKMVPVYVNSGLVGYTARPQRLSRVLRLMKRTGCLPPLSSSGFSIPDRKLFIYTDGGRPLRPLIICEPHGTAPKLEDFQGSSWVGLITGSLIKPQVALESAVFTDPLADDPGATLEQYEERLLPHQGKIEYIDPYEHNEILIANQPEHIVAKETTHMEVHPSAIMGLIASSIPFANHNQSPRNQLGSSQSKQGLSMYATNWKNRFDNTANVLCYGEAPLTRTIYQDYVGGGLLPYGQNVILALGMYGGYNQEDGIIMNADAMARGQFRSINYRSYEAFEENDPKSRTQTRIGHPKNIPGWTNLKSSLDYNKLDESGIVKQGEYVDQNTVIVARYMTGDKGSMTDASVTPQVWTRGRVESVVVTISPAGLKLVKIRVVHDRTPELGDKFCLTADHEVLTKNRGWVSIAEVTTNDRVAQLNREKECIEYVNPNETFVFDHTGEMYEVKTQGVNLCTTLNHRMYVQSRNSTKYELIEAKDMMGKRVKFNSHSPTLNPEYSLTIGAKTYADKDMNAFLTLFGLWMAEGWVYNSERDYISRLEFSAQKPVVQEAIKQVSEQLQLKSNLVESTGKYCINSKELTEFFKPLSVGAINKRLPKWCFELSQQQSQHLLEAMCAGDGHETKTSLHYGTSSIGLRDDLQILVQHAGYTSSYVKLMSKGDINVGKNGVQYKANADHWGIYIRRKRLFPTLNHGHAKTQGGQSEKIIPYEGKVYCISVPSEIFLVRREGTIVWTGNSNRHGQKGTLNVLYRGHDMPRTADGIVPDMIMNPTAIPSRMTIGQILEQMFGLVAASTGAIANGTTFMNEGSPHEELGQILESIGLNKMGNHILYNGMTGEQMESEVYMGIVYGMRLKHMTEDKWNARGEGRKEQRTHQPTGGRGNEGGLKIGEMERDAIIAHGSSSFLQESMMKRSDGTDFIICDGCGTIPLYNEKQDFYLCPMCDGPIQFTGELSGSSRNLEPIPPPVRSAAKFSKVEMPYATKLFFQEMATYANISTRILTTRDTTRLKGMDRVEELTEIDTATAAQPLPVRTYQDLGVAELKQAPPAPTASEVAEELARLNAEAVEAYGPIAPLTPAAAPAPPVPAQAGTPIPVPTSVGAPAAQAEPALQLASIAPQPLVPVDATLPVAFQPPEPVAEQEGGGPIIQVDTSDAALAAEGLRQPNDRNLPVVDESAELLAAKRATRSRSALRRAPQVQQAPSYQPQEGGQETPYSAGAPVQVVKLG